MTDFLVGPILVTSALPYANGSLHLGHLVEYIQSDIFVRFLRLTGSDVVHLCADDTHGTPIQIKAKQLGVEPEELIARYHEEHQRDFRDFNIEFDYYYTTHSEENRKHVFQIFERLRDGGHIYTASVKQYYCEEDGMFLPDRFIRGTCPNPKCKAQDQYGDSCEVCGLHYETTDLIDPRCVTCGNIPVQRSSNHYFFRLSSFAERLQDWTSGFGHLQEEVRQSIKEWLETGLKDWDVSRDSPYFGFLIPGETDKYFYVWLDAPVGYIAVTEKFCQESGRDFAAYWHNSESTIYHFIGKDIVYFHTLFWPAMLMGSSYTLPKSIFVHGFLTVNGTKMSKTRGTFITARTYLSFFDYQYLRYYYASKLTGRTDDLDLNLKDFVLKVNSELVNRIANLASRIAPIINRYFDGHVGEMDEAGRTLFAKIISRLPGIQADYEAREFARVTRTIIEIVDVVNRYINDNSPWHIVKSSPKHAQACCALAINVVKFISVMLKPILPQMAADLETLLNLPSQKWDDAESILLPDHRIREFKPLVRRIEYEKVEALIEASRKLS